MALPPHDFQREGVRSANVSADRAAPSAATPPDNAQSGSGAQPRPYGGRIECSSIAMAMVRVDMQRPPAELRARARKQCAREVSSENAAIPRSVGELSDARGRASKSVENARRRSRSASDADATGCPMTGPGVAGLRRRNLNTGTPLRWLRARSTRCGGRGPAQQLRAGPRCRRRGWRAASWC